MRGVKLSALRQNRVCETADDMRRGFGIGFSRLLWMHEEKTADNADARVAVLALRSRRLHLRYLRFFSSGFESLEIPGNAI